MNNKEIHGKIAAYIKAHPELSWRQIAANLNIAFSTVSRIAGSHGLSRAKGGMQVNMDVLNAEVK